MDLAFRVLGFGARFGSAGSEVAISRVISRLIWVISIVTLLTTLLITTHEPPSIAGDSQSLRLLTKA